MNTATDDRHLRPPWKAALGLIVLFGSGCSFSAVDADLGTAPTPPASPQVLTTISDWSPSARSVTLLPQPLESTTSFGDAPGPRIYVGGMGRFRSGIPADPFNRLALVILAASDSVMPMLRESQQLLLDIDGELYQTHPMPNPRLYSFAPTDLGFTETVIVPIDCELLARLATAKHVRGRIGHWITFDMTPEAVARLGDLLMALPEDFPMSDRWVVARSGTYATY